MELEKLLEKLKEAQTKEDLDNASFEALKNNMHIDSKEEYKKFLVALKERRKDFVRQAPTESVPERITEKRRERYFMMAKMDPTKLSKELDEMPAETKNKLLAMMNDDGHTLAEEMIKGLLKEKDKLLGRDKTIER